MIWCVEDDSSIRDIELYALQSAGFETKGFLDGSSCWNALQKELPDLVILDIMLPGMDGVSILKAMKASGRLRDIPVIMATAKGSEYDKIMSLDLGADDYLVKPFSIMELISRVKAVLRRCQPMQGRNCLKTGFLEMDMDEHSVLANGQRISLTLKEFELLRLLMSHPNKVYTRDQLYGAVWGMDYVVETRTVDMHIRTLRQKLGDQGAMIETVRGVGYLLRCVQ